MGASGGMEKREESKCYGRVNISFVILLILQASDYLAYFFGSQTANAKKLRFEFRGCMMSLSLLGSY